MASPMATPIISWCTTISSPWAEAGWIAGIGPSNGATRMVTTKANPILVPAGMPRAPKNGEAITRPRMRKNGQKKAASHASHCSEVKLITRGPCALADQRRNAGKQALHVIQHGIQHPGAGQHQHQRQYQ